MQITRNVIPINDLNNWFDQNDLVINRTYQREGSIWVPNARSYFIDTILNEFPFPKVTIRQIIDLKNRKTKREIVDGQQRIMAINAFINDELTLTSVSESYHGMSFSDLNDEEKENFLAYEVSVDLIISATEEEVLEIFRRMNSYTLPLNPAEQRHASYQGEFKWFVKDIIKEYTPFFLNYRIFTEREVSRMVDADFITELCNLIINGIESRSKSSLDNLYKNYDIKFPEKGEVKEQLESSLNYLKDEMDEILNSGLVTNYILYSLVGALIYNKYGLKEIPEELSDFEILENFTEDIDKSIKNISMLLSAFEQRDEEGNFSEFVKACLATTHSLKNRVIRVKWFILALQDSL